MNSNDLALNIKNQDVKVISHQKDIMLLNTKIKDKILDVLIDYFNQRHNLLKELMQVELIHGIVENNLFEQLVHPVDLRTREYGAIEVSKESEKRMNSGQIQDIVKRILSKLKRYDYNTIDDKQDQSLANSSPNKDQDSEREYLNLAISA